VAVLPAASFAVTVNENALPEVAEGGTRLKVNEAACPEVIVTWVESLIGEAEIVAPRLATPESTPVKDAL